MNGPPTVQLAFMSTSQEIQQDCAGEVVAGDGARHAREVLQAAVPGTA